MDNGDFTSADVVGLGVYDAARDRLGTVGAVDGDANALIVVPNPGMIEEGWAAVDDDTMVSLDPNWLGVGDESVARKGDDAPTGAETEPPEEPPSAEEWPYTVVPGDVDEIDDDGVHLRL